MITSSSSSDPRREEFILPPEEFAGRRERVYDRIGGGAFAALQGAESVRGFERFRQTNEFHYLCGVAIPGAYLVLDGRRRRAVLYLPHRLSPSSDEEPRWAEDAEILQDRCGLDFVRGVDALAYDLANAEVLFVPHAPAEGRYVSRDVALRAEAAIASDPWDGGESRGRRFLRLLRERLPRAEIRDLSPILDEMRLIKSEREVVLMRRAGELSAEAVMTAMRITRPGANESDLHAMALTTFLTNGADGEAYRSIIPGGAAHLWDSHYGRNDGMLNDGDLVLMDCAPDLGYYTSDIGRMWPVNGAFDPAQRELCGFVTKLHRTILRLIRPGVMPQRVLEEAAGEMEPYVKGIGFSKLIYADAARRLLAFQGSFSHPVGMAVHDVGSYFDRPLAPGLVFSVDPQLWIPEERLYIRAEDTGVVTESGFEPFTSAAPLDPDEIEAFMKGE